MAGCADWRWVGWYRVSSWSSRQVDSGLLSFWLGWRLRLGLCWVWRLACVRLCGTVGAGMGAGRASLTGVGLLLTGLGGASLRISKLLGDAKRTVGLVGLVLAFRWGFRWAAFSWRCTWARLRVLAMKEVKPSASTLGTADNGGVACFTLGAGGGDGTSELKLVASWRSAAYCSLVIGLRGDAAWGVL
jgi:hypothetical protein